MLCCFLLLIDHIIKSLTCVVQAVCFLFNQCKSWGRAALHICKFLNAWQTAGGIQKGEVLADFCELCKRHGKFCLEELVTCGNAAEFGSLKSGDAIKRNNFEGLSGQV